MPTTLETPAATKSVVDLTSWMEPGPMLSIEEKIKAFVRSLGVELVGIAGPERLQDGPPSVDPTYTMKGAKSIVSMIIPMDGPAIHDYMGKKSPVPQNVDQWQQYQRLNRICIMVAAYIRTLGYNAKETPANNNYRRSLYIFATHPDFSQRFGAMAAGIAGQGWSGNVMCEEYGASTYIGTVVTDAVLKSDPLRYGPRHFTDDMCKACKLCDKVCTLGMFRERDEEYILLNGALHPRGKRRDINFCNAACFGLHSVSLDKQWSTWSWRWYKRWLNFDPDRQHRPKLMLQLFAQAMWTGDSNARYKMIREMAGYVKKDEILKEYFSKDPSTLSQEAHVDAYKRLAEQCGVKGVLDDTNLTCANCGLICGKNFEETHSRYEKLKTSGIVVLDENGKRKIVPTYEEALKQRHIPKRSFWLNLKDAFGATWYFHKNYFGFEPRSFFGGMAYNRRLKKAIAAKIVGHKEHVPAR